MLGSEDHFWDPVLSFDPVSSKDEAQVARLGGTTTAESSSQPRNELLLPPEDTAIESKSACTVNLKRLHVLPEGSTVSTSSWICCVEGQILKALSQPGPSPRTGIQVSHDRL